jgi:hypothetical protein
MDKTYLWLRIAGFRWTDMKHERCRVSTAKLVRGSAAIPNYEKSVKRNGLGRKRMTHNYTGETMKTSEKIKAAVEKFGFSAFESEDGTVVIRNKKGQIAAVVKDGEVEQKYQGRKNLCGALVRNAIVAVAD